jgi:hypothetical protein
VVGFWFIVGRMRPLMPVSACVHVTSWSWLGSASHGCALRLQDGRQATPPNLKHTPRRALQAAQSPHFCSATVRQGLLEVINGSNEGRMSGFEGEEEQVTVVPATALADPTTFPTSWRYRSALCRHPMRSKRGSKPVGAELSDSYNMTAAPVVEVISAFVLAAPVCGLPRVNSAFPCQTRPLAIQLG